MQIDFKKYNADGIGSRPTALSRVASYRRQPRADKSTTPMMLVHVHRFPNKQTKPPTRNPPKRNRRGGACVPARTSAQRRFHTNQYTHCVRGMNDGCALVGRHGRAHRHRPYPSPLYIRVQSSPTTPTTHAQSTQTKRVNNPHTHRGRKCIAHSRPHSLK